MSLLRLAITSDGQEVARSQTHLTATLIRPPLVAIENAVARVYTTALAGTNLYIALGDKLKERQG
jgi:hypothetical protein